MSTIKLGDCEHIIEVRDANLEGSSFVDVSLAGVVISESSLERARFKNVHLDGAVFEGVSLVGVVINNADCQRMTIDGIAVTDLLQAWRASQAAA
jgi:uncharacterized protein YjbI with pentapeptide repeats